MPRWRCAAGAHRGRGRSAGDVTSSAPTCGLVAAGITGEGAIYVIADETVCAGDAVGVGRESGALWRRLGGPIHLSQGQSGREMVAQSSMKSMPRAGGIGARASRKFLRAEPVATLYEQGRVKHAGLFPALEDEMCDFGPGGLSSGRSPDRLDRWSGRSRR
jgi:phage terminase large subunit-like protein